jgi:hypothetical protein
MSRGRITRFEQTIEQLVEGSFARLFVGRLHPREVAIRLARAIEDNAQPAPDGVTIAPNLYFIHLNPADHDALMAAQPNLIDSLTKTVISLAHRADMRLLTQPIVDVVPDETIALRTVLVIAEHEVEADRATQALQPIREVQPDQNPRNPHLILGGTRYIPLDRRVINIGRRHDNHIVIDDMRVSRNHAQLRLRFGHYVLYDLGSSGGTFVNEHAVTECILKPGDVISLAGVALVYIEDDTSSQTGASASSTQIRKPGDSPLMPPIEKDSDPTL